MTEKQLSTYYQLRKEVDDLESRIKEFGDGVSGIKIKDIITQGGSYGASIQERLAELKDKYMERRITALEEYLKIETYINSVEDQEIRLIMRRRFLDLKSRETIGEEIHQERTTVAKKVRRYIKKWFVGVMKEESVILYT